METLKKIGFWTGLIVISTVASLGLAVLAAKIVKLTFH